MMKSQSLAICTVWMFVACFASANHSISQIKKTEIPETLVEQIINHPKIEEFFHPEVRGRVPLVISGQFLDSHLSLRKFGKPVRVIKKVVKKKNKDSFPILQFVDFEVGKTVVKVSIRYEVEGMGAVFTFLPLKDFRWKLIKVEVWET